MTSQPSWPPPGDASKTLPLIWWSSKDLGLQSAARLVLLQTWTSADLATSLWPGGNGSLRGAKRRLSSPFSPTPLNPRPCPQLKGQFALCRLLCVGNAYYSKLGKLTIVFIHEEDLSIEIYTVLNLKADYIDDWREELDRRANMNKVIWIQLNYSEIEYRRNMAHTDYLLITDELSVIRNNRKMIILRKNYRGIASFKRTLIYPCE